MPFEEYKDESGEAKTRYVPPVPVTSKEESEDFNLGDSIGRTLAQGGRNLVQNIYDAGFDEIATYNPQDALKFLQNPIQAQLDDINPNKEEESKPGIIGKALNMQPTTFENRDAPLPFYGKPLPEFAKNDGERVVGELISSAAQFVILANGIKSSGLKYPNIPFKKARTKELLASKNFLKKARGRFYRGAQEGYLPGGLNDYFLEDPWDGNFASLVKQVIPDAPFFKPVREAADKFIVDENDTLSEARLKILLLVRF